MTVKFGAGIWHFASYVDRYATDGYAEPIGMLDMIDRAGEVGDLSVVDLNYPFPGYDGPLSDVRARLAKNNLSVIGITPEMYTRKFSRGAFTNPDPGVRQAAHDLITEAAGIVRKLGASYVKLWPGQDGWDYPFQVDHHKLWQMSMDGVANLASENPDLKFVIEYKPREPRVHMSYDSVSRTLLALEKINLPNIGILLDFGHALYGGESPADSAQLAIDYGRLFGMDVNDNLRSWDDDMIAGSVHPMELFEFFYVLAKNNWDGVWQLDQFPFREDTVGAAKQAIRFLRRVEKGLERLDFAAMQAAQDAQDAVEATRLASDALFGDMTD
jgi:xylose isomerase